MEKTRKAHVADAVLLEFAGKEIEYLKADLPAFTAFDPDLNEQKVNQLNGIYTEALMYGSDHNEMGVLKGLTEKMSQEVKNCITIFKDVRYFARKKFGDSPATLKELCLDKYEKARKTQSEMVVFMYEVDKAVQKYKAGLMSAGLKETVINSIKPAAAALEKSNVVQESGKGNRMQKTGDRISIMNGIYDILVEFSDAARRVFENDPIKRSRYVLPYSRTYTVQAVAPKQ